MEYRTVGDLVRQMEKNDQIGQTTISKYVSFNLRENLEKIDAYANSRHISGDVDSQSREKPFFNIVTAATNIWYRATDIDRKNISVKAVKAQDYTLAFLANILLKESMRKNKFGSFLNEWGRSLARYGSSIIKIIEKDEELYMQVMPWSRMIVDAIDFDNNPVIEKLWMTPAQLRKNKTYDQEMVSKLIEARQSRETATGSKKDLKEDFIPIYEIHGELTRYFLTGNEEQEDDYVQQMHVISFVGGKIEGEFDDFTLASGKEAKNPYVITHLIKEDGRTQSIGSVEHLFETQWMMNHTTKSIKDQLDLASKMIFQTSDGNFVGQSALTSIENGDILIHALNQPLTAIYNKADIAALQNYQQQWKTLGNEITGVSEAMLGAAPKSGTAWRQTEALLQESHSLFEIMTENKGLQLEAIIQNYYLPFLKKKLDTTEEISAILEDWQIEKIDSAYIPNEAIRRVNKKMVDTVLSGQLFTEEMQTAQMMEETANLTQQLKGFGNQRFIKPSDIPSETWKEVLKDFEWKVEVEVTGEEVDRQAVLSTLTTVLQTIGSNPMILQDPKMKLVFNKIISNVGGISPLELQQSENMPAPQQAPQPQPAVGGQAQLAPAQ